MTRNSVQRFAATLTLAATTALACQVPVFRYALERWSADAYQLDVLYSDSLSAELSNALDSIKTTSVNVKVRKFDVNKLTESDQWRIGELPADTELPMFRLFSPDIDQESTALWKASASAESLDSMIDSDIRKRIVSKLASGVSAIWLIVPGTEADKTDSKQLQVVEQQLRDGLAELTQSMTLPEGVMDAGEIGNADFRPETPIDLDDVLRSHVPLKLEFAVLRLDPNDPFEQVTAKLLAPLLPPGGGVVPVFGRGRALPGIPMSRINPTVLKRAAEYIVGSCSCQVKAENPGVDLLINADWDSLLSDQLVVSSRDLPPLEGIGILQDENPIDTEVTSTDSDASEAEVKSSLLTPLRRNMLIAAVAFVVMSGASAVWLGRSNA